MPLRTSFHKGSPDFSLNTFISLLPFPLEKPLGWSGFSMAPSRSAAKICALLLSHFEFRWSCRDTLCRSDKYIFVSHAGRLPDLLDPLQFKSLVLCCNE